MINKSKNTYSVQRDTQQSNKDTKFSLEHNWYVTKLIISFLFRCYHFIFDSYYTNTIYLFCYYNNYLFCYCLLDKIYIL